MIKIKVKTGDQVRVLAGDHKGSEGKIVKLLRSKNLAIVEGVNMVSKHSKPNADNPQGGIVKQEAPIHLSNLMVVDSSSGKPSKIGRRLNDKGKLVRYSKKSGEEIK